MQFHLNGFRPGDPEIADVSERTLPHGDALPAQTDVLIVGCGPAGLTLAAQLAAFPDIRTCIVEQKDGPLQLGQADGVACRTMEMFQAFGFRERLEKEAYWVNETTFWKADDTDKTRIVRNGRVQDVEDGLSDFPHVILNQARVHDYYLQAMRNSPNRLAPHYARRVVALEIDLGVGTGGEMPAHPVTVRLERTDASHQGQSETVKARFVVGCDGARSAVRQALGRSLTGDSANQAWGVMDILAVTDFPDIRCKTLIQSADQGNILIIPREGGYLVRIYVEMDKLAANERVASRNMTADHLIAAAQRILRPYTLDVKEVAWWSVYEIGQRLCDKFDDVPADQMPARQPRVFIAGDACHTHSPKAGQGMNVSMQDAFNLGWKLAAVLQERSSSSLLQTYSAERRAIAQELIDFDREWASLLSKSRQAPGAGGTAAVDPAEIQTYFVRHGRYTAGTATKYKHSPICGAPTHQRLATGFVVGTRFHSAPVIRLADAKPMRLADTLTADGRWRLFLFADRGDPATPGSRLRAACEALLQAAQSPIRRYTPADADIDAVVDVRAIVQQEFRNVDIQSMPALLLPRKGRYGLTDYEKVFCPDLKSGNDIFAMRGIDRDEGCIVIVRPDQYVAHVLPLDAQAELAAFFDGFMVAPLSKV
ncbi:MAG: FAD-binding monooxygenase [Hyphomicrobiaceae bacterium]